MPKDHLLDVILNDPARLKAVQASKLLDSPQEEIFDRVTSTICKRLNVPISLVTIIAPERQFFKSGIGLIPDILLKRETPIKDSTCQYVVRKGSLVKINDVSRDPFFHLHEGLKGINAGSYLGTPLWLFNQAIGSVCAVDFIPRHWSEEQVSFLEDQAQFLSNEVSLRA